MITYLITSFLVLNIFFKVDRSVVYCGIFAFSGKRDLTKIQLELALMKIHILGLYNESRGTHGCGLYIGGEVVKGIQEKKLYSDFITFHNFDLDTTQQQHRNIIGHCRQASRGGHTIENTHPFHVINKKDSSKGIIGVKNGTISNIYRLSVDNDVSTAIENDSRALYEIIVNNGLDVLSKYEGGAAMIWVETETNKMLVYHGKSKTSFYAKEDEERPLFYLETEEGIYFSSIADSLYAISNSNDETVYELEHNKVYSVEDGYFTDEVVEINRSEIFKKLAVSHIPTKTTFHPATTTSNIKAYPTIWKEKPFSKAQKIIFCNGRFYLNGFLCEDVLLLDSRGYVIDEKTKALTDRYYYFIRGVMLKNIDSYQDVKNLLSKNLHFSLDYTKGFNFAMAISTYSLHPTTNLPSEAKKIVSSESVHSWYWNSILFTGTFHPLFSPRSYEIKQGAFVKMNSSDRNDKKQLYYDSYEFAFANKSTYFELEKNPFLSPIVRNEEDYPLLKNNEFFNKVFYNQVVMNNAISDLELRALELLANDYLYDTTCLIPDKDDINEYVQLLLTEAVNKMICVTGLLNQEEKRSLNNYLVLAKKDLETKSLINHIFKEAATEETDELVEIEEKLYNYEKNITMVNNKIEKSLDVLNELNEIADDIQIIDCDLAQDACNILYRHLAAIKKDLADFSSKNNLTGLNELITNSKLVS